MIRLETVNARTNKTSQITNFTSYAFDRTILTPAAAFRFTAPSVDRETRLNIRSGDTVKLYAENRLNHTAIVGVGFIDTTDTHVSRSGVDYVLSGRDPVGQLVDNDAVDENGKTILYELANLDTIMKSVLSNTRCSPTYLSSQLDKKNGYYFSTSPGETKINALQRILEFMNGLVWANNDGRLIVDKPNFAQKPSGRLVVSYTQPDLTNCLEARCVRNLNMAIRKIVTVQQGTEVVQSLLKSSTMQNMDAAFKEYRGTNVGRSVSRLFSYARGLDTTNQGLITGKVSYAPKTTADEYSARELARENMKILDVEVVVQGHFNAAGYLYNVDQIYDVWIEDENLKETMYVYSVTYELTIDHGEMTRMRLCKKWAICAYAKQLEQVSQ